jgi:hypothetical protein
MLSRLAVGQSSTDFAMWSSIDAVIIKTRSDIELCSWAKQKLLQPTKFAGQGFAFVFARSSQSAGPVWSKGTARSIEATCGKNANAHASATMQISTSHQTKAKLVARSVCEVVVLARVAFNARDTQGFKRKVWHTSGEGRLCTLIKCARCHFKTRCDHGEVR